ncbi:MAG TPA: alpha/beta hydrolase [Solirubrobacteraceae bacterium]|nr:alpha/beta hydrolase [Solirubrobacteraceae bacterium]
MPIAHQELGSPDAPVLVLIHGLGASGRVLERVAPLLAARFRVIVPDLPGFGETGGEPTTIEGMARAVLEVVDAEEFVAAGHSMGGLVATALAELAPDRVTRLVLVNAPPTYESRMAARGRGERILKLPVIGDLVWNRMSDDQIRATMRSAFAPGHDVDDVFVEDLKRTTRAAFTGSSSAIDDYLRRRPLPQRVAALTQQAFVIFGERDGRVAPASLDGYGPVANATVAAIPEAGHTPVWEAPERTAELILTGAGAL